MEDFVCHNGNSHNVCQFIMMTCEDRCLLVTQKSYFILRDSLGVLDEQQLEETRPSLVIAKAWVTRMQMLYKWKYVYFGIAVAVTLAHVAILWCLMKYRVLCIFYRVSCIELLNYKSGCARCFQLSKQSICKILSLIAQVTLIKNHLHVKNTKIDFRILALSIKLCL